MLEQKALSGSTSKAYSREINKFLRNFKEHFGMQPAQASAELIGQYITEKCTDSFRTQSGLRIHCAAIKYWYRENRQDIFSCSLPRIEAESSLRYLSEQDLDRLFIHTRMHVCGVMLRLTYAAGIRLNEVIRIRVEDMDFQTCFINLRDENDCLSHKTILPDSMKYELIRQTNLKQKSDYLFSLRRTMGRSSMVSRRTLQHFLSCAARELRMGRVTLQMLRDNFAMHLLEKGVDPRRIQRLMGFKNNRGLSRFSDFIEKLDVKILSPLNDGTLDNLLNEKDLSA